MMYDHTATSRSRPPILHRTSPPDLDLVWSSYELPFTTSERPYWQTFAFYPVAVAGDSTFVTSGIRYPVTVIDGAGEIAGVLGTPSASFKPLPVFEPGAFSDFGSYGTALADAVSGVDVVTLLAPVGPYLILVRSRMNAARAPAFQAVDAFLEVYDRRTGVKLYEDVPLPEGSRVLGGGRFLHLLLDDLPPWRIAKLRPVPVDG